MIRVMMRARGEGETTTWGEAMIRVRRRRGVRARGVGEATLISQGTRAVLTTTRCRACANLVLCGREHIEQQSVAGLVKDGEGGG